MKKRISKEERRHLERVREYIEAHTRGESHEELGRAMQEATGWLIFRREDRLSQTPDSRTYQAGMPTVRIFYRAFDLLVLDARSDIAAYEAVAESLDKQRTYTSARYMDEVDELRRVLANNMRSIGGAIIGVHKTLNGGTYSDYLVSEDEWSVNPVSCLRRIIGG